ncbi:MAG: hypothetical protein U0Y10_21755 [Spirosomataceae bacterium]
MSSSVWAQKKAPLTTLPPDLDSLNAKPRIVLVARNYGDSVVLRWTPNRAAYWLNGLRRGYTIQRIEVTKQKPQGTITNLTPTGIKPLPLDEMKRRFGPNDKMVGIAAQVMYGKKRNETGFSGEIGDVLTRSDEQLQQFTAGIMAADFSLNAATAQGLRWVDKSPKNPEALYVYRVWMNNPTPLPTNALQDTASLAVNPLQKNPPFAPFIDGIISGDGAIILRWLKLSANGEFSGFFIERSEDGINFRRLNDVPYVHTPPPNEVAQKDSIRYRNVKDFQGLALYTDSVKVNYKKFYYRIVGIDVFGDLSPTSEVMMASARDLTPPSIPKNVKVQVKDNKIAILTWEKYKTDPDLKGYVIGRGGNVSGPFKPLMKEVMPPNVMTYADPNPMPYIGHYYVVGAVDTAGNVSYALPVVANIEDHTPPAPPIRLVAKADTSGKITLKWQRNTEPDAVAYKVYRSYARENRAYNQLTPSAHFDTTFVDSLPVRKMLNREVYYKVVALDLSNNHSAFSTEIAVKLPDKIPPSPPVASDVVVNERGVQIEFVPSSSPDVAEHLIYRKEENTDWKMVKRISGKLSANYVFRDSLLTDQRRYEYAMAAVDEGGLISEKSFGVPVQYVAPKSRKTVDKLTITYDREHKGVLIHWAFAQPGDYHFVVYRSVNGEGLMQYHAVDSQTRQFLDRLVSTGNTYEYAIKVVSASGSASAMSQKVSWKVER